MQRSWGAALLAAVALAAAGCGTSTDNNSSATSSPATTAAATTSAAPIQVPAYELREDGKQLQALVSTDNTDELRAAFKEITSRVLSREPGGYHVSFDCAIGYVEGKAPNRLANGKIAVGPLGAAQTGLKAGQSQLDFLTGKTCQPNAAPTKPFDPNRQLDREYALELCTNRVEQKYVADQRPIILSGVNVAEASGRWTTTATAQGKPKQGGAERAKVAVECVSYVNPAGLLMTEVTKFAI